jgi:hypothetical protein
MEMDDQLIIQPCLLRGAEDLPSDTPLYKYLSIEAFLYFLHFNRLTLSRFVNWPDSYEGFRYQFIKQFKKEPQFAGLTKNDFFGSCWTLQTEDIRLYDNSKEHGRAVEDLQRNGSASMWEAYCRSGGVRIKTSLGKIDDVLRNNLGAFKIFRGKVYYEPVTDWQKTTQASDLVLTLFMKRIAFRHEAEYRYILAPKTSIKKPIVTVPFGDFSEFLDEVLICPATNSTKWISRTLYNIIAEIVTLKKWQKPSCKISQLYGLISESIGNREL